MSGPLFRRHASGRWALATCNGCGHFAHLHDEYGCDKDPSAGGCPCTKTDAQLETELGVTRDND